MKYQNEITHKQARIMHQSAMDDSIDEKRIKILDQHLANCSDCRIYAAELNKLDQRLSQSLQTRWLPIQPEEDELSTTIAKILTQVNKNQTKIRTGNSIRNIGWVAIVIFLVAGLIWTIKALAPIPNQIPAVVSSPEPTSAIPLPSESPLPTLEITSQEPLPTPTSSILSSALINLMPRVNFTFASEIPSSPDNMTIYQQKLSDAVTADTARQVAAQWGINGEVYSSPSEGMGDVIFEAMDGSRSMRFLNFADQFIYQVGYTGPDYGSALMDNGPLPSFDEQVAIVTNFLDPLGILDLPYQTLPVETERGMVAFIPHLDGYPVIQEIGVDRSNIGWIDVKVNTLGEVTMVQYSHHDFQPVADYPILTAQQAWDRFSNDVNLHNSRYAVLSPEGINSYQAWVRKFEPGQQADIYGWVNAYYTDQPTLPGLVMINDLPIIGDTTSMAPANRYDVHFIHAWGQIQGSSNDGIALNLAGWETSSLTEEYITGTLKTQDGQTQLIAINRTLTLVDPPVSIPNGTQVGIQGVILGGNPPTLNWKFIETGQIPLSYGASNSCGGGGGGGGGNTPNADFGGGGFASLKLESQAAPINTQVPDPYQPGDEINAFTGTVFITRHLYMGGKSFDEVYLYPELPRDLATGWGYSLIGENLSGIEQFQNLPIRVWGQVDHLENGMIYINVDRFEPVYPGTQIQAWSGTEQIVSADGQDVILFTTSGGEKYVINSSLVWGAESNVIGYLGDLIEIEGYIIPDNLVGEYSVLKDLAGSYPPDGVIDSTQVSVWDHSQDPSSNPGAVLQGNVTIDTIELAYEAINLDRCQAAAAEDPNMAAWLYVQPMWVFNGHFEDGRRFIAQVQALPDKYLK
jgi:hypothetical protein